MYKDTSRNATLFEKNSICITLVSISTKYLITNTPINTLFAKEIKRKIQFVTAL